MDSWVEDSIISVIREKKKMASTKIGGLSRGREEKILLV